MRREDAEEDVPDAAQAVKQPASVTELLRACHINTRLSMAQVRYQPCLHLMHLP